MPLDGAQNLQAAAAKEVQIQRQVARDLADQRKPLFEERARIIDLATHKAAKLRRDNAFGNLRFADAKYLHIVFRNIDAAARKVLAHILPEVG